MHNYSILVFQCISFFPRFYHNNLDLNISIFFRDYELIF